MAPSQAFQPPGATATAASAAVADSLRHPLPDHFNRLLTETATRAEANFREAWQASSGRPSGHPLWSQNPQNLAGPAAAQTDAVPLAGAAGSEAMQADSPVGAVLEGNPRIDQDEDEDEDEEDDYFQMLASIMDEAQAATSGHVREGASFGSCSPGMLMVFVLCSSAAL